jgi:uncharacterized protein (DUF924 family)
LTIIMAQDSVTPEDVLSFWRNAGEKAWWTKDDAFDSEIRTRFLDVWTEAAAGRLNGWQDSDEGTLALVIVLDQFPRNMFRNDSRAFSTDALACAVAHRAIAAGVDTRLPDDLRPFLYMPLMHSELLADQDRCVALFEQTGNPDNLKFAIVHADIIRKFGRFPHRNGVLGRITSEDEQAFLDSGGFSG